jgi:hypothetical protein
VPHFYPTTWRKVFGKPNLGRRAILKYNLKE